MATADAGQVAGAALHFVSRLRNAVNFGFPEGSTGFVLMLGEQKLYASLTIVMLAFAQD